MGRLTQKRLERERGLAELATRQHGVAARWQLAEMGFGEEAIGMMIAAGRLAALHRGVFTVGHRQTWPRSRWWAAVLAYGPGAVLSHRSAAAAWGLAKQGQRPIDVTAHKGRQGTRRRAGIWIHRCAFDSTDITAHDGLPVTTVARTLFDLSEELDRRGMERAFEEADRLHLLHMRELEMICQRSPGRRGLRPIQEMIALARAPTTTRSPLEERFQRFCNVHGIPAPATNVSVLDHEVDCLWPAAKLIAELDSWQFHSHRSAFERDRARDPKLMLAGYRTIRITHRRLDREANQLASEILGLLQL
jgi:hypothetical protein